MNPSPELPPLEAIVHVAAEYGLRRADLKPCVALLLDGNLGGADRRRAAFTIAVECRRMGLEPNGCARVLRTWAKKVGYRAADAERAVRSAYLTKGNGDWKYPAPGLIKKPGTTYEILAATCADVGCPHNCPPYQGLRQGPKAENLQRFEQLRWPESLRRIRRAAAVDVYRAICLIERERGLTAGSPLFANYRQVAAFAHRDYSGIGRVLDDLWRGSLLSVFERGSGSGPYSKDRRASRIVRAVPIPPPTPALLAAITSGGGPQPQLGGGPQPKELGGGRRPDIGGSDAGRAQTEGTS